MADLKDLVEKADEKQMDRIFKTSPFYGVFTAITLLEVSLRETTPANFAKFTGITEAAANAIYDRFLGEWDIAEFQKMGAFKNDKI